MRLTTWNCNGAFHDKQSAVLGLAPDVLIVPECAKSAASQPEQWQELATGSDWVGNLEHKGLGVFSFGRYAISRACFYNPAHQLILPLEVSGPLPFLLLAVWTLPDAGGSYVRPLVEAWKEYSPHLQGRDLVIAGDFNASVTFRGKQGFHFSVFLELVGQSDGAVSTTTALTNRMGKRRCRHFSCIATKRGNSTSTTYLLALVCARA